MASLNDVFNVVISRETGQTQVTSFSIPCFTAAHTVFSERAKAYGSAAEALADGFTSGSNVYKALQLYFSQNQGLSQVIVGRRHIPSVVLTPTVADSTAYSFTLQGSAITFTSDSNATAAEIVTGLKDAIVSAGVTDITTSGSTTLTISPTTAGAGYSLVSLSANLSASYTSPTETWADTVTAVNSANGDWFQFSADTRTRADVLAIAAVMETLERRYIVALADSDIATSATDDTLSQLAALGYDNTSVLVTALASTTFPEAGYVGYFAPKTPGSTNLQDKTISGLVADAWTTSQLNYIKAKKGIYYIKLGGVSVIRNAVVTSGEWADVIDFIYWLTARIRENLWNQEYNADKIGFSSPGIALYEGQIRAALADGVAAGGLASAPAPTVTMPSALSFTAAQRATRNLTGVKFSARLEGAILYASISGTVTA